MRRITQSNNNPAPITGQRGPVPARYTNENPCRLCVSPKRAEIERLLIAGVPKNHIIQVYRLPFGPGVLSRHERFHMDGATAALGSAVDEIRQAWLKKRDEFANIDIESNEGRAAFMRAKEALELSIEALQDIAEVTNSIKAHEAVIKGTETMLKYATFELSDEGQRLLSERAALGVDAAEIKPEITLNLQDARIRTESDVDAHIRENYAKGGVTDEA